MDKILSSPLQSWVYQRIISPGVFVIVINAIVNHIYSIRFNLASTLKGFPFPFSFVSHVVEGYKVFLLLAVFALCGSKGSEICPMHCDCIQQSCDSTDLSIEHRLQYLERDANLKPIIGTPLDVQVCKTRKFTSVVFHWINTLYNTGNF